MRRRVEERDELRREVERGGSASTRPAICKIGGGNERTGSGKASTTWVLCPLLMAYRRRVL